MEAMLVDIYIFRFLWVYLYYHIRFIPKLIFNKAHYIPAWGISFSVYEGDAHMLPPFAVTGLNLNV
jgi:hypothetical protein